MPDFKFENLEIWKDSIQVTLKLYKLTEQLRSIKRYSAADQLFRAFLSITNNIAEGAGSLSSRDFANFLNISRRSVFECASMILLFYEMGIISMDEKDQLIADLHKLSRKIYNFRLKLLSTRS